MVRVRKKDIGEMVADLMQSEKWVRDRDGMTGGLDGIRDLPRLGRPRAILQETISRIIGEMIPHAQALYT